MNGVDPQLRGSRDRVIVPERPRSPRILGIVCLVVVLLGLIGAAESAGLIESGRERAQSVPGVDDATFQSLASFKNSILTRCFEAFALIALAATGVGLCRYRRWGRTALHVFTWTLVAGTLAALIHAILLGTKSGVTRDTRLFLAVNFLVAVAITAIIPIVAYKLLSPRRVRESLE